LAWGFGPGYLSPLAWGDTLSTDTLEESAVEPTAAADTPAPPAAADVSLSPSHRQTSVISVNVDGQPQASVTCFCLTPDDRILAGCAGEANEIRVFDAAGKFVESWPMPLKPEAIFARADGVVVAAGEGQLVRLTSEGKVDVQKPSPHAAALQADPQKMREEVIAQIKQQAEAFAQQTGQFDKMIEQADRQIAKIQKQLSDLKLSLEDTAGEDAAEGENASAKKRLAQGMARNRQMLERRLASQERMKQQYESSKAQWDKMIKQNAPAELTDEQIDERVKMTIAYKMKTSSISATDDEVFLAAPAAAGYGFAIWRMDREFENGTAIVSELRGCCGQMDVKACSQGLFVAENAAHRVCQYDREGKLLGAWGKSDRTGLEGFGSCCNPMNVAFGPDDAVYTAEDNTGRIKRYSADGKLLGFVGSVELVPGCKNVSIAVNADGSRVYMLDITRNSILQMDPRPAGETDEPANAATDRAAAVEATDEVRPSSTSSPTARAIAAALKSLFGSGD
jgi:hypothetical protein